MRDVLTSCQEILQQASDLLQQLTDAQYTRPGEPYRSSIGQHIRHVLDHFQALHAALDTGIVNYDLRHRGNPVERNRRSGLAELQAVKDWLPGVASEQLSRPVAVQTEISVSDAHSVRVESSLVRELVFAASHAVHHYAVITMLARQQGVTPADDFGLAPATATFLRTAVRGG